jgi:iron(III) transport system permease protein
LSGEEKPTPPDTPVEEPELIPAAPLEQLSYYVSSGESGVSLSTRVVRLIRRSWVPLTFLILMCAGGYGTLLIWGINPAIQYLVVIAIIFVYKRPLKRALTGLANFILHPSFNRQETWSSFGQSVTRLRREMDHLSWVQLIAVLVAFGAFLIAPLLSVAYTSFFDPHTGLPSLYHFVDLFSNSNFWPWQYNPDTGQWISYANLQTIIPPRGASDLMVIQGWDFGAVLNSIYVAVIVTAFSVILGVFFAFIVARYDFFGKRVIRTVLIFPILATPFVGAIGIKYFMGRAGFFNNLFYTALHIMPYRVELQGLAAIIFVQSLSLFSLVYLNAYSSFMGIDPSLEEQAENLGAKGFKLFRSVTLPLAMPGIQAGAILTFILSLEDLGSPIVYQEFQQARKTLAFQVFTSIATQSGAVDPKGPAMGIILLIFSVVGFLTIRKYASLRSYESGTKGGQWNPRTRRLKGRTTILLYAVLIPVLFLALIPQISVIILSFTGSWSTNGILPEVWTFSNYDVLWAYPDVTRSIQLTLIYGVIATVFIVLLGTSAAYIIARRDIPGKTAFDLLVTSPIALPGIVIATGYFTLFYNTIFFQQGIVWPAGPWFLITISYMIRKFPFTVRAAYAGLQSTPVVLEEASLNMGATRNQTFTKITMPLIGVSVLAGSLLSFVYSVSEVSTSLILGSVGMEQAPMTFWTKEVLEGTGIYGGAYHAATLGVLMMALQMAVITVTNKILGTRSSAMTGI